MEMLRGFAIRTALTTTALAGWIAALHTGLLVGGLLVGCGESSPGPSGELDAGRPPGGDGGADGGPTGGEDGGPPDDAGSDDDQDAGRRADAGPLPDCDPGPEATVAVDATPVVRVPFAGMETDASTSSIRRVDLSGSGDTLELLVTEALDRDAVLWVRGPCEPTCTVTPLPGTYDDPVRTAVVDWDGDGDRDIIVADIGLLFPADAPVGRVLLLERTGPETFAPPVVLVDEVGRVACAEPGDFDGDGDPDVAVCEFGNSTGNVFWLEQDGGEIVDRHTIAADQPGAIHLFPFDADLDGDLDLASAISQTDEVIVLFRNVDGQGDFRRETLFEGGDTFFGTSGIHLADLDQDGDVDVLRSNGDVLDFDLPLSVDPATLHGLGWLENDGAGGFTHRQIANLWGAYALRTADFDGDCLIDVAAAAYRPTGAGEPPEGAVYLYLQRPDGTFAPGQPVGTTEAPELVVAMELADVNGDQVPDVWTGSLNIEDRDEGVFRLATQTIRREPLDD